MPPRGRLNTEPLLEPQTPIALPAKARSAEDSARFALRRAERLVRGAELAAAAQGAWIAPKLRALSGLSAQSPRPGEEPPLDWAAHDDGEDPPPEALQGTGETALAIVNVMVGPAMLTMPFAMKQGGGVAVAVALVAISGLLGFTLWLIGALLGMIDGWAQERGVPRLNRDWALLGEAAFGQCGRALISAFFLVDLFGCMLYSIIMAGANLHSVLPGISQSWLIIGTGAVTLVIAFLPMRFFAVFSAVGVLSLLLVVSCLLTTTGELLYNGMLASDQTSVEPSGFALSLGLLIVAFMAHSEAPLLYQAMEHREAWPKACAVGMAAALAFFLGVAAVGYLSFGGESGQVCVWNFGRGPDMRLLSEPLPRFANALLGPACGALMALKLLLALPFVAEPIALWCADAAGLASRRGALNVVKALLVAVATWLAVALRDDLALVMELCGVAVQGAIVVIFPCAILLKLRWASLGFAARACLAALIAAFSAYMALGIAQVARKFAAP